MKEDYRKSSKNSLVGKISSCYLQCASSCGLISIELIYTGRENSVVVVLDLFVGFDAVLAMVDNPGFLYLIH